MAVLKGTFHIADHRPLFELAETRGIPNAKASHMYMYSKEERGDAGVVRVKHLFKDIRTRTYTMVNDKLGTTKASYRSITTWKD